MRYKTLGNTTIKVSCIGLGGCPLGGHGWGNIDDENSIKTVQKALDIGINFFDTADIYGFGHSEKILSKGLGKKLDSVIIATKFGLRKKGKQIVNDCSPKWISHALKGSMKRLKIDQIPIYFIHYPDPYTPIGKTMEELEKYREKGKIRYIGCSNFPLHLIKEAQKSGRIDIVQDSYNITDQSNQKKFNYCKKHKIAVIAYGALAQGLLGGKYTKNTTFPKNDRRSKESYTHFHGKRLQANIAIVREIKKIATKYNKTCAQIALRWVLDNPTITATIVGAKTPYQIKENSQSLGWRFSKKDHNRIRQITEDIYKKYDLLRE